MRLTITPDRLKDAFWTLLDLEEEEDLSCEETRKLCEARHVLEGGEP